MPNFRENNLNSGIEKRERVESNKTAAHPTKLPGIMSVFTVACIIIVISVSHCNDMQTGGCYL